MSRPLAFRLLAALLLVAVAAALAARAATPPPDPIVAEAANPRRFPPTGFFGVNVDLIGLPPAEIDRNLAAVRANGFVWVRQRLAWRDVEPSPGALDWRAVDDFLAATDRHGLRTLLVLVDAPAWTHPGDPTPAAPPADPAQLGRFAAAVAERGGERLAALQVWDEPNIAPNWGARAVDPAGYARLLRSVRVELAAAGPPAPTVVAAGLAPNAEEGGLNLADSDFLDGLYRAGAAADFDVAAAKPYGLWYDADDTARDRDTLNFGRVELLREVMLRHGDAAKPLWAVEFGWNAPAPGWSGRPSPWGAVSEAEQAEQTRRAVERARAAWPWLTMLCVEAWDPRVEPDDPRAGFALVRPDLSPRPVLGAIAEAARSPVLGSGFHPVTLGPAGVTRSFRVTGSRVAVALPAGTAAPLTVSVDGSLPRQVDITAGNTRPQRAAPAPWLSMTVAEGLPAGEHTLTVGIAGPGSFDAELVVAGAPSARPERGTVLRWVLVAALLTSAGATLASPASALPWARWRDSLAGGAMASNERRAGFASAVMALVWYLSPAPLSWLALVAFVAVASASPVRALPLVVFAAPFWWQFKRLGPGWPSVAPSELLMGTPAVAPAEALTLALCAAVVVNWAVARLRRRAGEAAWRWPGPALADAAPTAFVALGVVGVLVAGHQREAVREWRTVLVEPVLFYGLCVGLVRRRGELAALAFAVVASAVVLSLWGLGQYALTSLDIEAEGVKRLRSLYPSPVNMGLWLGRALPLTVACALLAPLGRTGRAAWLAIAGVIAVALVLTFSGGAWIGAAAGLLVVAAALGRRGLLLAASAAAAVALLVAALSGVPRIGNALAGGGTLRLRFAIWQAALDMVRDHPLFGVGLDNFLYVYRDGGYIRPEARSEPDLSHPHNLILDFWLRLGLLGVPLVLATVGAFARRAVELLQGGALNGWPRAVLVGLAATTADTVVHGLTDNSYFLPDLAVLFWLSFAWARLVGRLPDA